jgi:hypothetical protein
VKNTSLKQDLTNILVPTLNRIKQAHHEITDAKGADCRMEYRRLAIAGLNTDETRLFREGAQKFLQYTQEFTRKVAKSQADYEQAHAKCQVSLFSLPFPLHSSNLARRKPLSACSRNSSRHTKSNTKAA